MAAPISHNFMVVGQIFRINRAGIPVREAKTCTEDAAETEASEQAAKAVKRSEK